MEISAEKHKTTVIFLTALKLQFHFKITLANSKDPIFATFAAVQVYSQPVQYMVQTINVIDDKN